MIILYVTLKSFKKNMIRIKILSKDFPIKEHITARHFLFYLNLGPKIAFPAKIRQSEVCEVITISQ